MHTRLARRIGVVFSSFVFVIALGCDKKPEITTYEVPRDKAAPVAPPVASTESPPTAEAGTAEPTRMIAAAVLRDGQAWYFKATGSEATVEKVADDVTAFIKSLKLPENQTAVVTWEVPEGWKEGPERMMREATLVLPEGEPPVEVAISKLTVQGEETEYLLANINRWRGQLGLKPVEKLDEAAGVKVVELDGGKAWVFDGVGEMSASAMMPPMMGGNAPFAGGVTPPVAPSNPPTAAPAPVAPAAPELTFTTPDTWKEGARGTMGSRSYTVGEPADGVIVKMSDFPPVGMMADPLANINRWRGQLGATPAEEGKLDEVSEPIAVADVEGRLTDITSPDGSQKMLAAMVQKYGKVWFFQMLGPAKGVEAAREDFTKWLAGVKIEGPASAAATSPAATESEATSSEEKE
ncbi:hypothetical protein [Aeoliella sp. SH292]|uniref:hypothetical protein n=1 Tax=Aeoliella sp. SH292 TaxID=3454464 RepID=UPI003F948BD8